MKKASARAVKGKAAGKASKRKPRSYKGRYLSEISFPLGGIGTGCIGLAGNGRLVDWEIYNRPNKGSINGFSHFAIKAEGDKGLLDARVLQGDLNPPYSGTPSGFGFGPMRECMAGLPHFRQVEFIGEYPFAEIVFGEKKFPGAVRMRAFNPFIPLKERDSGIPAAFFEIEVRNTTKKSMAYTIAGTITNLLPANALNTVEKKGRYTILHCSSDSLHPDDINFGNLSLATDSESTSFQQYWYKGSWFDSLEIYWRDLCDPGKFRNRVCPPDRAQFYNHGVLAAHLALRPGKTGRARFVISWSFPNCEAYWDPTAAERAREAGIPPRWKNYYATIWKDSRESALYALGNWDRLHAETLLFKESLYRSGIPAEALEAVSANLSTLKTPTVMRLQGGTLYGWEGCFGNAGCCEGSCTHVWNYCQALPFLFPRLERSMRDADFAYNQQADGGMPFRLQLPLGLHHPGGRSCADGLFGGVMKVYRDWKICGDTAWLRRLWPAVKRCVAFAWDSSNPDKWDPARTGVLQGRQHHTLDMELFGPNSWLTGFYLGALKAASEMADALGELETAAMYLRLFMKGREWVNAKLFNGECYHQLINLRDRSIPEAFGALDDYWDEEHGEIKYQIGQGSGIDQVLAQWHANLYGLGEIFDPAQTKRALRSLFKYNFKKSMRDFFNPCRIYCLNDEKGLVVCDWPDHVERPAIPLPYAQETQNGYEYAAAAHMIQNGLVKEGMTVVKAVRDRYDGEKRNPWNEFECGSNYARSMASYSLLNAFSGFCFDMVKGMIGFDPVILKGKAFSCFWSLDCGWGEYMLQRPGIAEIRVHRGTLRLKVLRYPFMSGMKVRRVSCDNKSLAFTQRGAEIELAKETLIKEGQVLCVQAAGRSRRP